eukprot:GHUV01034308.1.p1 GENE.GHUV01034308.1~~GHUV01034308.1.p1  ORF type:complete len:406 (+),score=101.34 GHUV01034308.1:170-1387(+)
MPPSRVLKHNSIWDLPAVLEAFRSAGIKERHVYRIWSSLLRHPDIAWTDIPEIPKAAVSVLEEQSTRLTSSVLNCQQSVGADTTKLLIQLQDGMQVEAVVMHYDTSERYAGKDDAAGWGNKRGTLCVSSQVGCQMGCTFCATGTMGLKGNLSCGEIIEQLVHAVRVTPIRNIVFMGMGEPLTNYDAVKAAVSMMCDSRLFGISKRHITVSTVGVVPRIKQMATDMQVSTWEEGCSVSLQVFSWLAGTATGPVWQMFCGVSMLLFKKALHRQTSHPHARSAAVPPHQSCDITPVILQGVSLALSLHAPNQELRKQIVPSARAYPLPKLMAAIQEYQSATQQRIFVEYVMLAGDHLPCNRLTTHPRPGAPAPPPVKPAPVAPLHVQVSMMAFSKPTNWVSCFRGEML